MVFGPDFYAVSYESNDPYALFPLFEGEDGGEADRADVDGEGRGRRGGVRGDGVRTVRVLRAFGGADGWVHHGYRRRVPAAARAADGR